MPFRRPFRRSRRFSATPRRRWGSGRGTVTPRLQVCNFDIDFDNFIIPTVGGEGFTAEQNPAFNIQSITPWENISEGGYDRSVTIRGIISQVHVYAMAHDAGAGEVVGLPSGGRSFARGVSAWFVDTMEGLGGAPVSFAKGPPFWPFATMPPIAAPDFDISDSAILPTRILKRDSFLIRSSRVSNNNIESEIDVGGYTRHTWKTTVRKRLTVDSRQALYWGIFTVNPLASIDLIQYVRLHGCLYYTINRK